MADLKSVEQTATRLMALHGLTDKGWTFAWDRAVRRFGICKHKKRQITLSRELTLLNDEQEAKETILHEIAHALVGPNKGHGPEWKQVCLAIGGNAKRCHNAETPDPNWEGVCPAGHTIRRHRKPRGVSSCTTCAPAGYSADYQFTWYPAGTAPVPARPAPKPTSGEWIAPAARNRQRPTGGQIVEFAGRRGQIVKINRTRYQVRCADGRLWSVRFDAVVLSADQSPIPVTVATLTQQDPSRFRVGQRIITHQPGSKYHNMPGTVTKINPTRVRITLDSGGVLNAPPELLRAAA